ncbi:MAG: dTDP-4-dehydrorhamnose reductase [Candidatus Doudnabacteria bacterium]|jgi:dTDP-4-dehydrorhamnose reductase
MENQVLILGSKGMLGGQLIKVFGRGAIGWDREDIDVTDTVNLKSKILNLKSAPQAVINCVAYNDVDGAEKDPFLAGKLNRQAPRELAQICKDLSIPLVHFSTNYVFDGEKGEYAEKDLPHPQSVYGETKFQGELEIVKNTNRYYIIRTSVLFGLSGESKLAKKSFVDLMLSLSEKQNTIKVVADEINSLTFAPDLAQAVKKLLDDKKDFGVYHITNSGQASWFDFAQEIFRILNKQIVLEPVSAVEFKRTAKRPKKAVLLNTKLPSMRSWQEALREFLNN